MELGACQDNICLTCPSWRSGFWHRRLRPPYFFAQITEEN